MSRIAKRFEKLKADKRAGLVIYISAGDPNAEVGYEILKASAGRPAPTGRARHWSSPIRWPTRAQSRSRGQRALKASMTVDGTFDMVRRFRKEEPATTTRRSW